MRTHANNHGTERTKPPYIESVNGGPGDEKSGRKGGQGGPGAAEDTALFTEVERNKALLLNLSVSCSPFPKYMKTWFIFKSLSIVVT